MRKLVSRAFLVIGLAPLALLLFGVIAPDIGHAVVTLGGFVVSIIGAFLAAL